MEGLRLTVPVALSCSREEDMMMESVQGKLGIQRQTRKMDERKDVKFFKWRERKKGDEVE